MLLSGLAGDICTARNGLDGRPRQNSESRVSFRLASIGSRKGR